jgi:aryl-alcohol dehydrogenase (NADP+)
MEYVNLGKTGLKVSRICLGMMSYGTSKWRDYTLDEDESRPFIQYAIEQGVNFFDTADVYSQGVSEEVTGRAIRDMMRREEAVVATKGYFPIGEKKPNTHGLSRKYLMSAIDASLQRLGMDYVDLYQIHRWDYDTPIEETMEALHDIVKSGKARYIGASSMFVHQFIEAQHIAQKNGWTPFIAMQNHYNLIYREEEREMIPYCIQNGIGLIPWSPLARGFLAGNRTRKDGSQTTRAKVDDYAQNLYYHDSDYDVAERVAEIAEKKGVSAAQVALAWVLHQPGINAPIVGASKLRHLEEAFAAMDVELSDEDMATLEEPYQPHPVLGHT